MKSQIRSRLLSFGGAPRRPRPKRIASTRLPLRTAAMLATDATVSGRMKALKTAQKTAFIPFLCAGDPDLKTTAEAIKILNDLSADVIELGVPYSDPLADGPVIHGAATRALEQGTKLDDVLTMVKSLSPDLNSPVVLFTYINPILARGLDVFCRQIKEAGAAGLLVPDLPLELTHDVRAACERVGIELILLVTPTTPEDRMKEIAKYSQGFVYLVSVTGVTGARTSLNDRIEGLIEMLHGVTEKSVAVGFGVSNGEQARKLQQMGSDGVIVGSALVKALHEGGLDLMKRTATSIKEAIV